jgi:hypothetical protein
MVFYNLLVEEYLKILSDVCMNTSNSWYEQAQIPL